LFRTIASLVCLLSLVSIAQAPAAETNPFAGVWTFDAGKSKAESGALPKTETRTYATSLEGALTIIVEGADMDSAPYAYAATGDINGREYPVVGRDVGARILGDAISWKRIDANTVEMTIKKKGEIINMTRHAVSVDGKTLTIDENGVDDQGRTIRQTRVYGRR
jgi:hypothetical protein